MRKYVVPGMLLMGIALLSPRANAVELVIKGRAVPPAGTQFSSMDARVGDPVIKTATGAGSIPFSAISVSGGGQLWGIDFALAFDTSQVTLKADGDQGSAVKMNPGNYAAASDVLVSGSTFVGTGLANPQGYVGVLKGATALLTPVQDASGDVPGAPSNFIGSVRVQTSNAAALYGTVTNFSVIGAQYNVQNSVDGSGNPVNNARAGATAVTSTATPGAPVNAETVVVDTQFPGYAPPDPGAAEMRVPLGKIALGLPGDVNGDQVVDTGDALMIAKAFLGVPAQVAGWNAYKSITGDVSPSNTYANANSTTPNANGNAAYGGGYGDGQVEIGDAITIAKANTGTIANIVTSFPLPEAL